MIIGAFEAFETLLLVTGLCFVDQGVELLLFPAMAEPASLQALAPFRVAGDKGAALPVFAKLHLVVKEIGSAAKVLKIVRIDTLGLVVLVVEGAPLSLEVEHVEVEVDLVRNDNLMEQSDLDVLDGVSKTAKVAILARGDLAWVKVAEFGLVLLTVVESLHTVVSTLALVAFWALFSLGKLAKLRGVDPVLSPPVLEGVEEVACLVVVSRALRGTFKPLEFVQQEVLDKDELPAFVVHLLKFNEDLHV